MLNTVRRIAISGPKAPPEMAPRCLFKGGAVAIVVAGALVGFGSAAQADVLTQSATFSITQTNPNEFTDGLPFDQLNPAVGTLQDISIAWNGQQEALLAISSQAGGAFNVNVFNDLRLSDTDTFALLANSLDTGFSGVLGAGDVSEFHAGPASFFGGTGLFSADDALFQGAGTVDLTVTQGVVQAVINLVDGGATDIAADGGTSDSNGTVDSSYFYTPSKSVPEPGSAPLFASGLLGLGIALGGTLRKR